MLDIRDPWTYGSQWQACSRLAAAVERKWARIILAAASRSVFTSPLSMPPPCRSATPARPQRRCVPSRTGTRTSPTCSPLRSVPDEKCLMSYVGSFNPRRRPDVLLDALQRVCRDPEVARDLRLQFVGGMAGHEAKIADPWRAGAGAGRGAGVATTKSVRYMRGADVNLAAPDHHSTGQDVIAGKTFEYLATRKPILGVVAPEGGDAWLLRETGGGRVVPFGRTQDAVADEILRLWKLWKDGTLADSLRRWTWSPIRGAA